MSLVYRVASALAVALLVGCDSNPEGPRVPPRAAANTPAGAQTESGDSGRQPITKSRREIVNPE